MGKIWLKSVDPSHQCCGCEGKAGPCDSCCINLDPSSFGTLTQAQNFLSQFSVDCLAEAYQSVGATASLTNIGNTINISVSQILDQEFDFSLAVDRLFMNIPAVTNIQFDASWNQGGGPFAGKRIFIEGACGNTNGYDQVNQLDSGPITVNNVQPGYYRIVLLFQFASILPVGTNLSYSMSLIDTVNPSWNLQTLYVQYGPSSPRTLLKCS